jgi:hypothetical protein
LTAASSTGFSSERQIGSRDPDEDFLREVEGHRSAPEPEPYERGHRRRTRRSLLDDLLDFD